VVNVIPIIIDFAVVLEKIFYGQLSFLSSTKVLKTS
jgi:hypothetical protein